LAKSEILISVEPRYFASILSGEKTVELRRRALRITEGARIWLYCKAPIASISAVCQLRYSETLAVADLWTKHGAHMALTKSEYDAYLAGRDSAHALVLTEVRSLDSPIDLNAARALRLNFQPPQFFMHLRPGCDLQERLVMAAG